MSIGDSNKKNIKDEFPGLSSLPELESLPELDDLFDQFDSDNELSNTEVQYENKEQDDSEEQNYVENSSFKLPKDNFDDESEDLQENTVTDVDSEENPEERVPTEIPPLDEEFIRSEEFSLSEEDDDDDDDNDIEDYDDEIDIPDMEFEQFKTIDEEDVNNPTYDETNDGEVLDNEDDDPYDYDLKNGFAGGLLPGVNLDEYEYKRSNEENEPEPEPEEKVSSNKPEKASKGFKELDEDRVKEFFAGIIDKVKGLKFGKKKNSKTPKNSDKFKLNFDKTKMMYIGIIIAVIIVVIVALSFLVGSSHPLNEIEVEKELSEINVDIDNFSVNEDKSLNIDITNKGDISGDFSMYLDLKEKSSIPFTGDTVNCESEIIAVEPGAKVSEKLSCNAPLKEDIEYKVSIDIDEL